MQIHLDHVLAIAREAHQGQRRRHGAPYIGHPVAVRTLVEEVGAAAGITVTDVTRATALLHDVVEDSEIGRDELAARFGDDVARRVELLTKVGKGHDVTDGYYRRLRAEADDALRLVKVCDRLHNLSELQLAADRDKLTKYVDETLEYVVPLAAGAERAAGLVAALHDALRAACRAQGATPPPSAALPASRVPVGIYGVVHPSGPTAGAALADATEELTERVGELVDAGVAMVQLRAKTSTDREVLALLEALKPRCRRAGVPLIVNDRADLCVAAGADGVHLGQTDLPPAIARLIVGETALVGASSHTAAELDAASITGGADHVAIGPVFASTTKTGHAAVVGVDALAHRTSTARLPIVAIGGITNAERVAAAAHAGASLVAAVSALEGAQARSMCRRLSVTFFAARAARERTA